MSSTRALSGGDWAAMESTRAHEIQLEYPFSGTKTQCRKRWRLVGRAKGGRDEKQDAYH